MKERRDVPGRRVQLHRALSKLGLGSRGQAWLWIEAGRVRLNGRVVREPLTWVNLDRQTVTLDDEPAAREAHVTLALNKPRAVVTTRSDERGRRTVHDLLPAGLPHIFPAGRLDLDSEGLLILTSDSGLSTLLTNPEHRVAKTYHVTIAGQIEEATLDALRGGIELPDGRTRPAIFERLRAGKNTMELEVILTEGRNRQIRRMLAAVGHKVRRLVRVAIGGLELGDLPPGEHRILTEKEIARLTPARS